MSPPTSELIYDSRVSCRLHITEISNGWEISMHKTWVIHMSTYWLIIQLATFVYTTKWSTWSQEEHKPLAGSYKLFLNYEIMITETPPLNLQETNLPYILYIDLYYYKHGLFFRVTVFTKLPFKNIIFSRLFFNRKLNIIENGSQSTIEDKKCSTKPKSTQH